MPLKRVLFAGFAGTVVIGVLAFLSDPVGLPVLVSGFGSSCVLVFTFPHSPLARPTSVVCGHLVSTLCGLCVAAVLPVAWWSIALATGLALVAMAVLRVSHPPAGGSPIAVMTAGAGWSYLVTPVLVGVLIVVAFGLVYQRYLVPRPATADPAAPEAGRPDSATRPEGAAPAIPST
jgi:CBS-domain-containing membrane protein